MHHSFVDVMGTDPELLDMVPPDRKAVTLVGVFLFYFIFLGSGTFPENSKCFEYSIEFLHIKL